MANIFDFDDFWQRILNAFKCVVKIASGIALTFAIVWLLMQSVIILQACDIESYFWYPESDPKQSAPSAFSEHNNIERALWAVDASIRQKEDVNGDKLVNCIDAALVFYREYPDESKVQIVQNKRPDGRMNHLFNAVYTNGTWIYIEPQAYFKNWNHYEKYLMRDIWGRVYDPTFNLDQTDRWKRYLNGRNPQR